MSAAEYLIKVLSSVTVPAHDNMTELLAPILLIDSSALEIILPPDPDNDVALSIDRLSVGTKKSLQEQAIRSLLVST
jgi:hypothetical protein